MTIVNQYPIVEYAAPAWIFLVMTLACLLCLLIATLALISRYYGIMIWFGVFFSLFLIGIIWLCQGKETGQSRYECLIDDDATSFIEVMEDYDIVGRRGDLWVLEDKADE